MEHPIFMYTLLKLPGRSVSSLVCSTPSKPNTPLCIEMIALVEFHI